MFSLVFGYRLWLVFPIPVSIVRRWFKVPVGQFSLRDLPVYAYHLGLSLVVLKELYVKRVSLLCRMLGKLRYFVV